MPNDLGAWVIFAWGNYLGIRLDDTQSSLPTVPVHQRTPKTLIELSLVQTISEYIWSVARWASKENDKNFNGTLINRSKKNKLTAHRAEIFARYYGVYGETQSRLVQMAHDFGTLRASVEYILRKMQRKAKNIYFDGRLVKNIKKTLAKCNSASVDQIDEQLRGQLGERLSIVGADRFARDFLYQHLAIIEEIKPSKTLVILHPTLNSNFFDHQTVNVAYTIALEMIQTSGVASIDRLSRLLQKKAGRSVSTEEVRQIAHWLGVAWLDQQKNWFWFGASPENRILQVAKKIRAIVQRPISVSETQRGVLTLNDLVGLEVPLHVIIQVMSDS